MPVTVATTSITTTEAADKGRLGASALNTAGRSMQGLLQEFLGRLPKALVLRLAAALADLTWSPAKALFIRGFARLYQVDMREAAESRLSLYPSFNAFFTRALAPDQRPIGTEPVSPCDGRVTQCGRINGGRAIQAKGMDYGIAELLGQSPLRMHFDHGSYLCIYLAPGDYHRVHLPLTGRLLSTEHIPGHLYAVNAGSSKTIPRLYVRNERLVSVFVGAEGKHFAVVMVAAIGVSGIRLTRPLTHRHAHPIGLQIYQEPLEFAAGEEFAVFELGSTVIVLAEDPLVLEDTLPRSGDRVRMGQSLKASTAVQGGQAGSEQ